jgi:aminoglycoside phosphotransferase (APT) family kinase protein
LPLAVARDPEVVRSGLAAWHATRTDGTGSIASCQTASAGLSSETYLVRLTDDGGATAHDVAVRLPPVGEGIFPEYGLHAQAAAQNLAAAHGVPAPAPAEVVDDQQWLDTPFLVMPLARGTVPGPAPNGDPWVGSATEEERAAVFAAFVETVLGVHRVGVVEATPIPHRDLEADLGYWGDYLDWYSDGNDRAPVLREAFDWCVANRPSDPPAAFLWGDVRLGNLVFDESRVPVAVLDWEMSTFGAPEHDIGWHLALDATMDALYGNRVDGFPTHAAAVAMYERGLGRSLVDPQWFETFALFRSTAIMTRLGVLHERVGRPGAFPIERNPIHALLRDRIGGGAL